jgi:hypothetical protein
LGWVFAALGLHKRGGSPCRMIATNNTSSGSKFPLGRIVATPAALAELAKTGDSAHELLTRHVTGDYGAVCKEDWKANDNAIAHGERVFSAYMLKDGQTKLWVITEADRSSTTLLTPDEY